MRPLYDVDTGAMANRGLQGMGQASSTLSRMDKERPGAPGKSIGGGIMSAAGGAVTASALGAGAGSAVGAGALAGAWGGPVGLAAGAALGGLAYYMS